MILIFCVTVRIEYVEGYFLFMAISLAAFMVFMIVNIIKSIADGNDEVFINLYKYICFIDEFSSVNLLVLSHVKLPEFKS